jgi:hypothetical protein
MSRLCNFPQIGEFLNAQAISDTTHWGKRTLTLSVYTLLPWSSMVYIRCILFDEEPAERYDRTRIGAADRSGPGRDYADPVQSGIKVCLSNQSRNTTTMPCARKSPRGCLCGLPDACLSFPYSNIRTNHPQTRQQSSRFFVYVL